MQAEMPKLPVLKTLIWDTYVEPTLGSSWYNKKKLGNCLGAFTVERNNGFHLAGLEIDFDVPILFATYHNILSGKQ